VEKLHRKKPEPLFCRRALFLVNPAMLLTGALQGGIGLKKLSAAAAVYGSKF
jgi:hypothetical protein